VSDESEGKKNTMPNTPMKAEKILSKKGYDTRFVPIVSVFENLFSTFCSLLPPEKASQVLQIENPIVELIVSHCEKLVLQNNKVEKKSGVAGRNRYLLRLVVGKVSYLIKGEKPLFPRSLIEGLDFYLQKSFGPVLYRDLNEEIDHILGDLTTDQDDKMWKEINQDSYKSRLVDTIFIRILFRFENFTQGQTKFISILDSTMNQISTFHFKEEHFFIVFESMFNHLWPMIHQEELKMRWDFYFGDGTSQKIIGILKKGLANWLKRENNKKALQNR
jgi:hypothetical protein